MVNENEAGLSLANILDLVEVLVGLSCLEDFGMLRIIATERDRFNEQIWRDVDSSVLFDLASSVAQRGYQELADLLLVMDDKNSGWIR